MRFTVTSRASLWLITLAALLVVVMSAAGSQEALAKKKLGKAKKWDDGVSGINSIAAWGANEHGQLGNGT